MTNSPTSTEQEIERLIDNARAPDKVSSVSEEPDWLNAETCIENAEIAYEDSIEDEYGPVDTVISSGDLGVVIGLAKHALALRSSAPRTSEDAALFRLKDRMAYLLTGIEKAIQPLTLQGEDRIWRAATKACELVREAEEEIRITLDCSVK